MRTLLCGVMLAVCAAPVLVVGQSQVDQELTRAALEANRKVLVNANMALTEEEKTAFWPLYDAYQKDLDPITDRLVKLIEEYADSYSSLTDEKAKELLAEFLDIDEDLVKLKKAHVKKFEKRLASRTVARYFQLENKFEAIVEYELARKIPLVR